MHGALWTASLRTPHPAGGELVMLRAQRHCSVAAVHCSTARHGTSISNVMRDGPSRSTINSASCQSIRMCVAGRAQSNGSGCVGGRAAGGHLLQLKGRRGSVTVGPGEQEGGDRVPVVPQPDPTRRVVAAAHRATLCGGHHNLHHSPPCTLACPLTAQRSTAGTGDDKTGMKPDTYPSTHGIDF